MNKLLSRDSVKSRLADPDGGLSYTEFSYQVFQSYDWLHLHREHDCSIQIGGSDQVNILPKVTNVGLHMFVMANICSYKYL
jgi:tyrosyl-tRNA synthetase